MLFITKRNTLQQAIHDAAKVAENHEIATVVGAAVVTVAAGYGSAVAIKNGYNAAKTKIANRDINKITKLENQINDLQEKIAKATPEKAKKLNEKLTKLQEKLAELKGEPDDTTEDTEDDTTENEKEDTKAPEDKKEDTTEENENK